MPRRTLDARLVQAVQARGGQLTEHRVTHLEATGDRVVVEDRLSARMIVGTDEVNSVVRRHLQLPNQPAAHLGVALRGYAAVPPGPGRLEIRFPPDRTGRDYCWCFTAGVGRANVGVGTFDTIRRPRRSELETTLRQLFPAVQVEASTLRGHRPPLGSFRPTLGGGRVLLAGDAASLVDPLTGEGAHHALVSKMLAGRIAMPDPKGATATYAAEPHRRIGRRLGRLPVRPRRRRRRPGRGDPRAAGRGAVACGSACPTPARPP